MDKAAWLKTNIARYRCSQREIAKVIGLDPSAVSRIMTGHRDLADVEVSQLQVFFDGLETALRGDLWTQKLNQLVRASEIAPEELAARSDVPLQALTDALTGRVRLDADQSARITKAVGIGVAWLAEDGEQQHRDRRLREIRPRSDRDAKARGWVGKMPIYAAPVLTAETLIWNDDVAEMRPYPQMLEGVEKAYGVYVGGDYWGPRFRSGDVLFVHPAKPLAIGDDVLAIDPATSSVLVGRLDIGADRKPRVVANGKEEQFSEGARIERIVGAWWA